MKDHASADLQILTDPGGFVPAAKKYLITIPGTITAQKSVQDKFPV